MTITTELVLARHGEAICNQAGIVGGETGCTGLTPLGHDQARQLAKRLAAEHSARPFDAFYATSRQRVRQTAEAVTDALGLQPTIVDDLRGPHHGDADGRPWHEIKTAFGGPPQHDPDRPYATGSETWNQYLARAMTVLDGIIRGHRGQRILITAHGETIEAAHCLLLDLTPEARTALGFITDHACVTRWELHVNRFGREVWTLACHNDTSHLANGS
jgi:probable phosphoglycerate mutase